MKIIPFQKKLMEKSIDFCFFICLDTNCIEPNISYFSRYNGFGALIIPKKSKPFLLVPEMELERAKKNRIKVYAMRKKKLFEILTKKLKKNRIKAKTIGIDYGNISVSLFKALRKNFKKSKTININDLLAEHRKIKTNEEIGYIKKACRASDEILKKCFKNFKKLKTEKAVANFLENETKKRGLELAFPTIVASGSSASMPHYEPQNIKLKKGFCIIDFGVKYKGYCSDTTRTVYIGNPSKKELEFYEFILQKQEDAIKNIALNHTGSKIYNKLRDSLEKYEKFFNHGLGHGVGIKVHELPNITDKSKDRIENNMVFTIEPGVYFKNNSGIRIEDTILFKNKAISLTKISKNLLRV